MMPRLNAGRPTAQFVGKPDGYPPSVISPVRRVSVKMWRRIWSSPVLTLNGYVAFDLPRTVTGLGASLLTGLAAVHAYVWATRPDLPLYFLVYVVGLCATCLGAAAAMAIRIRPAVPQAGWYAASMVCMAFLVIYVVSRLVTVAGLVAVTGRWDLAPGTLAMALAGGVIAVHTTVLSGINVAYPQRQNWHD